MFSVYVCLSVGLRRKRKAVVVVMVVVVVEVVEVARALRPVVVLSPSGSHQSTERRSRVADCNPMGPSKISGRAPFGRHLWPVQ